MARRWFSGLFSGTNRWIWEFFAPSRAAGLDGPSGAHQTSGESLGAEIITERTLRMTARMVLTRAGAQEASAAGSVAFWLKRCRLAQTLLFDCPLFGETLGQSYKESCF